MLCFNLFFTQTFFFYLFLKESELFLIVSAFFKPPSCVITRMGGAFDKIMAEYVLGYVLAKERYIIELAKEQENKTWHR